MITSSTGTVKPLATSSSMREASAVVATNNATRAQVPRCGAASASASVAAATTKRIAVVPCVRRSRLESRSVMRSRDAATSSFCRSIAVEELLTVSGIGTCRSAGERPREDYSGVPSRGRTLTLPAAVRIDVEAGDIDHLVLLKPLGLELEGDRGHARRRGRREHVHVDRERCRRLPFVVRLQLRDRYSPDVAV